MSDFLQLLVAGIALGSVYALICLGFVVIYRATGDRKSTRLNSSH